MFTSELKSVNESVTKLLNKVISYVTEKGGFINTSDIDNDAIYAYRYDFDNYMLVEERVISVMVEDGELYVALSPTSCNIVVEKKEDFDTDDWFIVSNGEILLAQTILSIAESIEYYVYDED